MSPILWFQLPSSAILSLLLLSLQSALRFRDAWGLDDSGPLFSVYLYIYGEKFRIKGAAGYGYYAGRQFECRATVSLEDE